MNCQSANCRNAAHWHRPAAISGCANQLCNGCMLRIYSAFPQHTKAWLAIPAPTTAPPPPTPSAPTTTPDLFS